MASPCDVIPTSIISKCPTLRRFYIIEERLVARLRETAEVFRLVIPDRVPDANSAFRPAAEAPGLIIVFPRTRRIPRTIPEQENVRPWFVDRWSDGRRELLEYRMGKGYRIRSAMSGRFPMTLHRRRRCNTFAMSRLLFWVFSTVGLWANFWCCRAILLYPENTVFQVSSKFTVDFYNTRILSRKQNFLG